MEKIVTLARSATFSSGRLLRRTHWDDEQNRTAYGRDVLPHGHDYLVNVFYRGVPDVRDGMVVNVTELKPILARVLGALDGQFLGMQSPWDTCPPTAENLTRYIAERMPQSLGKGHLQRLELHESARLRVIWKPLLHTMRISRKFEFAAAHRLNAPTLSEAENRQIYDKCNNLAGHGHNYQLEVFVEGEVDEAGVVIPLPELDQIVDEEVYSRFDHKHLNVDCPEFRDLIPTSENLAQVIFSILQPRLEAPTRRLAKIGLHETQKNYFEVEA